MRTKIALALAVWLFAEPLVAQSNYEPPKPQWIGPALIVTAGVIAGCIILYLYREHADPWEAHVFVLYRDHYDGYWEPIATRTIALSQDKARAIFWDAMKRDGGPDSGCRYRVLDLGPADPLPIDEWLSK